MVSADAKIISSILAGERLALARLLTQVENDLPEGRAALSGLFAYTGRAHWIGVTGAPGTGKSSLVNQLAHYYRHPSAGETPRTVAIVAVDPSSPFTGGAILGDRVRMRDLTGDPGVFIRSMATRGSLGGLAHSTASLVQVFDAAGYEIILIETVGVGQAEVDIVRLAHTTLVIEAPGLGDDIQAIKAGILEIADVLIVNKADRPGVENTERALLNILQLARPAQVHNKTGSLIPSWTPPVLRTVATEGIGIGEVAAEITRHREYLLNTGNWEDRERLRLDTELESLVQDRLVARWHAGIPDSKYQDVINQLVERRISPQQAVDLLIVDE